MPWTRVRRRCSAESSELGWTLVHSVCVRGRLISTDEVGDVQMHGIAAGSSSVTMTNLSCLLHDGRVNSAIGTTGRRS